MHEVIHPLLAAEAALALRELVVVVGELEVVPAGVDVHVVTYG